MLTRRVSDAKDATHPFKHCLSRVLHVCRGEVLMSSSFLPLSHVDPIESKPFEAYLGQG